MTKAFAAPLLAALVLSFSPALADDCHFTDGTKSLTFASPTEISIDGEKPYSCDTSSGGTGVSGRVAHCSDGFDGPVVYNDDETITFRDAVWKPTCEEAPLDLMN